MSEATFSGYGLAGVVREIADSGTSGQLHVARASQRGTLVLLARHVVAASLGEWCGTRALEAMLAWESGQYQFRPQEVLLARVPAGTRILPPASLSPLQRPIERSTDVETAQSAPASTGKTVAPEAKQQETAPGDFGTALRSHLTARFGPAGGILLNEAFDAMGGAPTRWDLGQIRVLRAALEARLPESYRATFAALFATCTSVFGQRP